MFGFKVEVRFTNECVMLGQVETYRNVTEIHWNYREGMVAFESDIHGTGITYDTKDIAEFEATVETDVAGAF